MMSDDKLFRWNFTLALVCKACGGASFVEEVVTGEIFCTFCGKVLAQSKEEWPEGWDDTASFGNLSGEKGWIEYFPRKEAEEKLDQVDGRPPLQGPELSSPLPPSGFQGSESPLTSPPATTPSEPSPLKSPASESSLRFVTPTSGEVEIEDCIEVQLPPHLQQRRHRTESVRSMLEKLARTLDLSETIVDAAERLCARVEKERLPKTKLPPTMLARSALLVASRHAGIPKTFAEMERDLPKAVRPKFHKHFKLVDSILKKDVLTSPTADLHQDNCFPLISVESFISSVGKALDLSKAIQERAVAIANTAEVKDLFSGKRPNMIAAVVLSFAAECENVFMGTGPYAKAASVSEVTVQSSQRLLLRFVEDMAGRGPLPAPLRAPWNTPGYRKLHGSY